MPKAKVILHFERCSARKSFLRNFAKFIGKQLCQILLFDKVAGYMLSKRLKNTL